MAIREHPKIGSILMCDFDTGFVPPEMVKRRPVVVVSPKIAARPGLCTVVPLSTTPPDPVQQFHCQIDLPDQLPAWLDRAGVWVKADMMAPWPCRGSISSACPKAGEGNESIASRP